MGSAPVARWRTLTLAALLVAVGRVASARADVSDDRRALVMLRVLAYDNHLEQRIGDEVRVVIVYPTGDDGADEGKRWTQAFANIRKLKVGGRPVVVTAHKFETAKLLGRALHDLRAAALVSCDGLGRSIAVPDLAAVTRANRVLSFSTRESDVVKGLAVGIIPGTARDEIVVNVDAAAAEGVKFDAGLLQLARKVEVAR
jgi:YfiR/HmsC-like